MPKPKQLTVPWRSKYPATDYLNLIIYCKITSNVVKCIGTFIGILDTVAKSAYGI